MIETFIIHVDKETQEQASTVFQELGLDLNSGINLCLKLVILHQGFPIPFVLKEPVSEDIDTLKFETEMGKLIKNKISNAKIIGHPIALFDEKLGKPYLEYPNGHRDYDFAKQS